jgi:Tol biopolymer transport system component
MNLTSERWQDIARIYELVVDMDPRVRDTTLAQVCAGDDALRRKVESLLRNDGVPVIVDHPVWAAASRLLDQAPEVRPGATLGPYRIEAPLGAGGMGEVFRATDTRLNRRVAIKVLPGRVAFDPRLRARFAREAQAVAALAHPHICTLHDVGRQNGMDFLVMEHLEGETLAALLVKGPLPFTRALTHAVEIASALDHAHRHGIVHRDLKPANIMLTAGGAKLLDFGLARFRSGAATREADVTAEGAVVGTVRYMAPEQLEGGDADARSDLFSFGAAVHEMLTGQRAFDGESAASVTVAILEREPPAVSSLQPETPPALDHIVRRCLAKDPDERWQTAGDVMRELKWVFESLHRRDRPEHRGNGVDPGYMAAGRGAARRPWWNASRRLASRWIGIVVMTASAVGIGVTTATDVRWRGSAVDERPVTFDTRAPAGTAFSLATMDPHPALSPDGQHVAFVAMRESRRSIWIQTLGRLEARRLPDTDGAGFPFWSPDGRSVGFFAADSTTSRLKRISVGGDGAAVELAAFERSGMGGAWSDDGTIVFSTPRGLYRVASTGGTATPLTVLDAGRGETAHRFPVLLPDAIRFLYLVLGTRDEHQGLYLGSLNDPRMKQRIVPTDANGALGVGPDGRDYLFFVRDFTLLAQPFDSHRGAPVAEPIVVARPIEPGEGGRFAPFAAAGRTLVYRPRFRPRTRLAWVDRRGIVDGILGTEGAYYRSPSLSPDQNKVAVSHLDERTGVEDIWVFDLRRQVSDRLTTERIAGRYPAWLPDSRRVIFLAQRATAWGLYSRSIEGGGDEQPLFTGQKDILRIRAVTPDARYLLFTRDRDRDLWTLPLEGERNAYPLMTTPVMESHGRVSPDGRWLAFAAADSGQSQVYVTSFPTPGERRRVSADGGTDPQWRADGRELYFVSADRMMAVPVVIGPAFDHGTPVPLFRTSFEPFSLTFGSVYTPAPDGQRFLVVETIEPDEPRLVVSMRWSPD